VSVKLTPEICINKASSNSRLTAAGRQATATDQIKIELPHDISSLKQQVQKLGKEY
jgi:hypothetical protein